MLDVMIFLWVDSVVGCWLGIMLFLCLVFIYYRCVFLVLLSVRGRMLQCVFILLEVVYGGYC